MSQGDALDLIQSAIWVVIVAAGPVVGAAMAIGVTVALMQALTQVQEATLTFVPKMIVTFVVGSLTSGYIGAQLYVFTLSVYGRIEHGF